MDNTNNTVLEVQVSDDAGNSLLHFFTADPQFRQVYRQYPGALQKYLFSGLQNPGELTVTVHNLKALPDLRASVPGLRLINHQLTAESGKIEAEIASLEQK